MPNCRYVIQMVAHPNTILLIITISQHFVSTILTPHTYLSIDLRNLLKELFLLLPSEKNNHLFDYFLRIINRSFFFLNQSNKQFLVVETDFWTLVCKSSKYRFLFIKP